ncbi:laminin subunit alpha-1-like isoform X1 [Hydractinia symbiolongicarpus]|uniref:laminin subunit alpha-1-like isoform X1 n=2 Tax=Hydractinia symbiolongicarpus TaxID=13093 RepID=UPI00254B6747|nr:laminin subunit alpha-1-like isoform X1 [Hydractinia symbiolongicarpus]
MQTFYLLLLVISLKVNYLRATVLAKGFDAFLYKPVIANITCGSPREEYYNTKEGYVAPRLRVLSVCDAQNPLLARPARYLTDGNISTSWQSTNNVDKAYINVNLQQAVFGKQLLFQFGDYRRPGQIAIYKSSDFGKTYTPWHYMVSQRQECTTVFGIPDSEIYILPDQKINRVLCQEYSGYPFEYGEQVLIELNGEIRGDGSNVYESTALLKWMNVTNVYIRFSGMYRKFDFIDTRWHHYVVSQISLIARCDCNGHGDGISCPLNVNTGSRTCACQDNTCGTHCEMCCPYYNQYPWKRGSKSSWISDSTSSCEQCNCHSHSQVCRYDKNVADRKLSLDIHGKYSGGGVCLNCLHNTEGINCEKCKQFFYRPPNVDASSIDACPPCGCSLAGSRPSSTGIQYLECIRHAEMAKLFPGKNIGDCFCKQHVIGSKCDMCMNGFYRLEASNNHGCRPCACHLPGTVQRLNTCHKDFFGQCPCKANVKLRDCSKCKDGYYDLRNDHSEGCKWCDCDVGASISPYICHKVTGVCTCRAHIYSRRCKQIQVGYYFPSMHYIQGRRYLYAAAQSTLTTTLTIPHDSQYKIFAGYILMDESITTLTLSLKLMGTTTALFGPNLPVAYPAQCVTECYQAFQQGTNFYFFLKAGVYSVQVASTLIDSAFMMERIIAIPVQFMTASILSASARASFLASCNVENNDLGIGTANESVCMAAAYSMTIKFEDGALPCKCNPAGSVNATCNKVGGQCYCKSGVGGRDCSYCLPGFYDFSDTGCIACGCQGPDPICNPNTGACNCPINTQGRVCDACACNGNSVKCERNGKCLDCQSNTFGDHCELCKPGFFGDVLQGQCRSCDCHVLGSYNQSCDLVTGQCPCRPGVVNTKCDKCATNYFGLSIAGCTPCNCNLKGSMNTQCAETGQCSCFISAEGLKCDKCKQGFYGLPSKSCQTCNCNSTGTVLNTQCINDEFGQCDCKSGVMGRACDACMKQYAEFGINGCKQCPLCTRKLQSHADEVAIKLKNVKQDLNLTKNLSNLQAELVSTQGRLQQAELNAALFQFRVAQGRKDYKRLQDNYLIPWNARLTSLINQINIVTMQASQLTGVANAGGAKMLLIYDAALKASQTSQESNTFASTTFSQLVNLNSLASKVVSMAYSYVQNSPTFDFDTYERQIDLDLALSNRVLGNITNIGKQVTYQQTLSVAYLKAMDQSEEYFKNKEQQWASSRAAFLQNVQTVYATGKEVESLLNQTKSYIDSQRQFIMATEDEQNIIRTLLAQTDTFYKQTQGVYEQIRMHTQTITGGIEVMFLPYVPQNSIVRVNVLRGYHLVPRDYPSLKSDPYFKLSIFPRWFNQGPLESAPKTATLDPTWDWPIGGTYTFFITPEQIQVTKLIISLYDYDADNSDDFMGEVVINLADIMPIKDMQNTYTLTAQHYTERWSSSYPGAGENGLLDLQNMLRQQINVVESLLTEVNTVHATAKSHANSLQTQAQLLTSEFDKAKQYAAKAVNAVNTYNEIYRLINSSLEAAVAANTSVQSITKILNGISVTSFTSQANAELLAAQRFLAQSKQRNVTYGSLNLLLRSETLGSAGVQSPPRSIIQINGIDYHPHLNGHSVLLVNYRTGAVEQVQNFRTDINPTAAVMYDRFLQQIQTGKVVIIVKQGSGSIATQYRNNIMSRLLELGGQAPFFSGHRGSYILLGYRRQTGDIVPWIAQVAKLEGAGASELRRTVQLKSTLQQLLYTANTTFHAALPQWNEINRLFPVLKVSVATLLQESSTASVVQAALEAANVVISQAVSSASQVLRETQNLLNNVNDLTSKYNYLVSSSANITSTLNAGQTVVTQAETKVQSQQSNLLQAVNMQASFAIINQNIENKQSGMNSKLSQLQSIASQMPFTIEYKQRAQSTFSLRGVTTLTRMMFTVVQFDVQVKSLNGILWYLFSNTNLMTGTMGLYMKNGYMYFVYNLGYGDVIGKNSMQLAIGRWYTVHVTRSGIEAFFILRDSTGFSSMVMMKSAYVGDVRYMSFDVNSRWYLNGFPSGFMTQLTSTYGSFYGVYDNFYLNGVSYNLWNSFDFSGQTIYANYRFRLPPASNGSAVTFFGNGYIRQRVGTFLVSNSFSSVQLEFRTLKDNIVIFGVTGQTGSFIYGLYIFGGKLMFQFATSLGSNIAIITNNNFYNNGDWYRVMISRSGVNATLSVRSLNPAHLQLSELKTNYIGVTNLPTGIAIIFGSTSTNSPVPPPVSGKFAGDMRYASFSDVTTGKLIHRSFLSSQYLIEEKDTSYYGMINGQIVEGVRFYGYMWWLKTGSYAMIQTFRSVVVSSIYISFKTSQLSGLIMYKTGSASQHHFYMGLIAGNLVVVLQRSNSIMAPYVSSNLTLSDGQWHNMSLAYTGGGFQLQIDAKIVYTGWFGNVALTTIGTGDVYIGGLSSGVQIGMAVPTTRHLQIDFESFLINRMQQNFFSGSYVGVSYAGITPGSNQARPPPACAASFPDLIFAPDPLQVRFGKVPWASIQSYIGYRLSASTTQKYFQTSFVVTMSFRAVSGDGVIFYIANSDTNPTQYVSLELINGRLRYEFHNGQGKVTIETGNTTNYAGEGKWYKIYLLRIYQFGAILIPETMEYKNSRHDQAAQPLYLTRPLYIGGLPNNIVANHFMKRKYGFNGCLRKFEISSGFETYAIDFTRPDLGGTQTGTTSCYSNTETGVYFNGKDSWVNYANNFILHPDFTLELRFRTYKRSGTLLYLFSNQTPNGVGVGSGFGSYMLLELEDGKINFHYKPSMLQPGQTFVWKDSKGDKSYYLCDQRWHTLKISKTARSLRIKVDSLLNMGGGVVDETNSGQINGFMYIGGVKGGIQKPGQVTRYFDGCLQLVSLGQNSERIQSSVDGNNVVFGCPTF